MQTVHAPRHSPLAVCAMHLFVKVPAPLVQVVHVVSAHLGVDSSTVCDEPVFLSHYDHSPVPAVPF